MKFTLPLVIVCLAFVACTKEFSYEGGQPAKLPPVQAPVEQQPAEPELKKYQLKAFYSDIPIDFDETDDEVKLETDLWAYVQDYIKDDINVLYDDGGIKVFQNQLKMPGLDSAVLDRRYTIKSESIGETMMFLSAAYQPAKYRLYEMTNDHFIIGVKFKNGARVYSRFERVP